MATPAGPEPKMIRVRLFEDEWRDLRVRAAEEDVSVTSLVNRVLREYAKKVSA